MRRFLAWLIASTLAGCGATNDCDDLHPVVAPSSSNDPGTLQAGIRFQTSEPWAMTARPDGGVVAVTCSGLVILDDTLHETGRADTGVPRAIAVAPDGAIYAVTRGADQNHVELVALTHTGKRRWSTPVPSVSATAKPVELVAAPEGPYVGALVPTGNTLSTWTVFGFDAATGAARTLATAQGLLAATQAGVLTYDGDGNTSVTLHQLDPTGHTLWSHTLTAASANRAPAIRGAVATPDGGAIILGRAQSTLDLGDRVLPVTTPVSFVAAFDATGATRWAFTETMSIMTIAAGAQGQLLMATTRGGGYAEPDGDASLLIATSAGVSRSLTIDGPGSQSIAALAFAPDGLAWLQVHSGQSDDNRPLPAMHIGDRTFTDDATYLFKLVP